MNINEFLSIFYPILYTILTGFIAYMGKEIIKALPSIVNLIVAKIGLTNYHKMKEIASDVFNKVEENGRLGKLVDSKISTFETLIMQRFPEISAADIDLVRDSIAGEYNKGKVALINATQPTKGPI